MRNNFISDADLDKLIAAHDGDVALLWLYRQRFGALDAEKAAFIGLYHDVSEIITGDMPTPVKYGNQELRSAYKEVEAAARDRLLGKLPEDLRNVYQELLEGSEDPEEEYMRQLVKAADKLSALIKCVEEERAGNTEFETAGASTEAAVKAFSEKYPEVADFCREFLPSYGKTLDELLREG